MPWGTVSPLAVVAAQAVFGHLVVVDFVDLAAPVEDRVEACK